MSQKKSVHELTTDDLLTLVDVAAPTASPSYASKSLEEFIELYRIKPGAQQIHYLFLFNLYKTYTKNSQVVNKLYFRQQLKKFLPRNEEHIDIYFIDESAFTISLEQYKTFEPKPRPDHLKNLAYRHQFDEFIQHINYKPHERRWTKFSQIYDEYIEFRANKKPMKRHLFIRFCDMYFNRKKTTNRGIYYGTVRPKNPQKE